MDSPTTSENCDILNEEKFLSDSQDDLSFDTTQQCAVCLDKLHDVVQCHPCMHEVSTNNILNTNNILQCSINCIHL
jgi:hypothetical protein